MSTVDGPLTLRVSSGCPSCGVRHVLDVTCGLEAQPPGSYSVAGAQTKVAAVERWSYRCTACGATGDCAPMTDYATMATLSRGDCGHLVATNHYPGHGHILGVCPGCCPVCNTVKDANR